MAQSPHSLKLSEVARRHSKGTVDLGQGGTAFGGQSTSRSDYQGHWNPRKPRTVSRPTAGGNPDERGRRAGRAHVAPPRQEASPLAPAEGARFEGTSSMRADFGAGGAAPVPRKSMRHRSAGRLIGGDEAGAAFDGQSTHRAAYHPGGRPGQGSSRRDSIKRKPSLHTNKAVFEGCSTMRSDYGAAGGAKQAPPRHAKTTAKVDHIRLTDGVTGARGGVVESVAHHDYTAKTAERLPPSTLARVDHVVIGDANARSAKAVESVAHHDYTAKIGGRVPASTTARVDHVVIGDANERSAKAVESVAHHDYTAKIGGRLPPSTLARVDHVVIGDANSRSAKAVESVAHHDYTAKIGSRVPASTTARVDHVVIGDANERSAKAVESVAHHDYTGERGEVPQPNTTARVDHIVIADGSC